jgi:hypothetical protein
LRSTQRTGKPSTGGRQAGLAAKMRKVCEMQSAELMLMPARRSGNEPGEPDAGKPACPVRERGGGDVPTSEVRERRASFPSLLPAL